MHRRPCRLADANQVKWPSGAFRGPAPGLARLGQGGQGGMAVTLVFFYGSAALFVRGEGRARQDNITPTILGGWQAPALLENHAQSDQSRSADGALRAGADSGRDLLHQARRGLEPGVLVAVGRVRLVVEQPEPVLLVVADRHASFAPPFEIEHELAHEVRRVVPGGMGKAQPIERRRGDVPVVGTQIEERTSLSKTSQPGFMSPPASPATRSRSGPFGWSRLRTGRYPPGQRWRASPDRGRAALRR